MWIFFVYLLVWQRNSVAAMSGSLFMKQNFQNVKTIWANEATRFFKKVYSKGEILVTPISL